MKTDTMMATTINEMHYIPFVQLARLAALSSATVVANVNPLI
jgi:hypothetical protein